MPSSNDRPYTFSAPLPSPTSTAPQHFHFPPSSAQRSFQAAATQQSNQFSHQGQARPQSISQALSNAHQQQQSSPQQADQGQSSITPSNDPSSPLRRDFGLLAEAAKRAQIAVITRDMGDVGL